MFIRSADPIKDYDKTWDIFHAVIQTGDTYTFGESTPKEALRQYWFADNMDTFVAVDDQNNITGTYFIRPNQVDRGRHIANCGYMVHPGHHGKGIGKMMCEHSISFAKEKGYLGMQFNFVVSTNTKAVALWVKCGFKIIGTIPKGFMHKELGLVDAYIMYRSLED